MMQNIKLTKEKRSTEIVFLDRTKQKGWKKEIDCLQQQRNKIKQIKNETVSIKSGHPTYKKQMEFQGSRQNSFQEINITRPKDSLKMIGDSFTIDKYQSFTSISSEDFFNSVSQEKIKLKQLQNLEQDQINENINIENAVNEDFKQIDRQYSARNKLKEKEFKECQIQLYHKGYRLESYLSSGGQGFVFKGFCIKSNLKVAIKLSQFGNDGYNQTKSLLQTITKQMEQEDRILKEIKCFKYIIQTYELFLCNQIVVQVMELCLKDLQSDLQERKQQNKPYSLQEITTLMFQLINSLIEIHVNGIVHLDIKPGNILLTESGDIKLTDFGISNFYQNKSIIVESGTLYYCSPEQLQHLEFELENLPQIDEKSDIFSMGLTFLMILGIELSQQQVKKIRSGDWSDIELDSNINRTIFSFIKYFMLCKDPMMRQRSFILKLTLIDYLRQFIDLQSEIIRINQLIVQFQDQINSKYLAYLYCFQGLLSNNFSDLEMSINIAQNTQGFMYVDLLYINQIYGTSLVQNLQYSKGQEILLDNLNEQEFINQASPDIVESLNSLALSFERLGDDKIAFEFKMKALKIRENQIKGDHPYIADSLRNLAVSYERLGDDQKALETSLKALQMRERLFQGDHPDIAQSLSNLAVSYSRLGDDQKALEYEQKALKMKQNLYKGEHADIADSLCSLSVSSSRLGDDQKALEYQIQALQMRESIFLGDHPSIAESLNILGISCSRLGDNQRALDFKLKALKMRIKIFEGDHPDIAQSLSSLAVQYSIMGDNQKALEYQIQALEMREKLFQGDHPDIAQSLSSLAVSYSRLGNDEQGLACELKALQIRERLFKGEHPEIADNLSSLADSFNILGQKEKALQYEKDALEMREKLFKNNHPDIAYSLNRLGIFYQNMEQFQDALQYHLRALSMRELLFQGDTNDILESFFNLVITYDALGDTKLSQEYEAKYFAIKDNDFEKFQLEW